METIFRFFSREKATSNAIAESEEIAVAVYRNFLPPFIELQMERLYQHLFSSLPRFRIYGDISRDTSAYVARRNGKAVSVLLFRVEKNQARVLNEQIKIAANEIERFARTIFDRFESVNMISFHAIETEPREFGFPHQRHTCTEDIVLALPPTAEEYRASLGKATRSYINRYMNRLRRDFPSLRFDACWRDEASERQVRDIIELNRARMAGKNKSSHIDESETERIVALVKQCGLVNVMTIDGRVCAGTINYRIGENYFLQVIAHDPAYNDYRLGTLCCYLSICECIARGGREYHFLWGQYEYKYRLLGVQHDLDHIVLYRSRLGLLRNGGTALQVALDGHLLAGRRWLLDKARQQENAGFASRLAFRLLNLLRRTPRQKNTITPAR